MGYVRQTALVNAFLADTKEDLILLPQSPMGSTCLVISDGIEYICNSKGKWIGRASASTDTNHYTKTEIDDKIKKATSALTENEVLHLTLPKNL